MSSSDNYLMKELQLPVDDTPRVPMVIIQSSDE
jgi:hypothetical protein